MTRRPRHPYAAITFAAVAVTAALWVSHRADRDFQLALATRVVAACRQPIAADARTILREANWK